MKVLIPIYIVLAFIVQSVAAAPATITGRVVGVYDGDTITVLDETLTRHRIRLAGIDAPELGQAYGELSRNYLAEQVTGKNVSVEWSKKDKYKRPVGKVMMGSKDQCLEQVRGGFAWHYKKYEVEQTPLEQRTYRDAEQAAREAKRGLWVDHEPVAPWQWRKEMKLRTDSLTQ